MLADPLHELLLPRGAVRHQELCVEHLHFFFRQSFPQHPGHGLCLFNGVDDDTPTAARLHLFAQETGQAIFRQRNRLYRPAERIQRNGRLADFLPIRPGQERIAAAGLPRCIRCGGALLLVGFHQLCPPPGRQRG